MLRPFLDVIMIRGEDENTGGLLRDARPGRDEFSHHRPTVQDHDLLGRRASRRVDDVGDGSADRSQDRARRVHGAAHREIALGHRCSPRGVVQPQERMNVLDEATHVKRKTGFRDDAARHLVHKRHFVSGRIESAEPEEFDARAVGDRLQGLVGFLVFLLQSDDGPPRAGRFLHTEHSFDKPFGKSRHELLIDAQERFAFGAVGYDDLNLGGDFDMGRKSRSAAPDNTGGPGRVSEGHRGHSPTFQHWG